MSEEQSSLRAQVLVEVNRVYEHRVMNNVHRSDYVEAIVAVALADYGWTRKDPWDGWDCEHESGVRLEVKQSAAAQTWEPPQGQETQPTTLRHRPSDGVRGERCLRGSTRTECGRLCVRVARRNGRDCRPAGAGDLAVLRHRGTGSARSEDHRAGTAPTPGIAVQLRRTRGCCREGSEGSGLVGRKTDP